MRAFTELVIDQIVRGNNVECLSPPKYDDLLGKADEIVYEIEVEDATVTSGTMTIVMQHRHSCSGKGFIAMANLLGGTDIIANLPYREVKTQAGPLGGLGRVSVALVGSNPVARVRVWATGRSS